MQPAATSCTHQTSPAMTSLLHLSSSELELVVKHCQPYDYPNLRLSCRAFLDAANNCIDNVCLSQQRALSDHQGLQVPSWVVSGKWAGVKHLQVVTHNLPCQLRSPRLSQVYDSIVDFMARVRDVLCSSSRLHLNSVAMPFDATLLEGVLGRCRLQKVVLHDKPYYPCCLVIVVDNSDGSSALHAIRSGLERQVVSSVQLLGSCHTLRQLSLCISNINLSPELYSALGALSRLTNLREVDITHYPDNSLCLPGTALQQLLKSMQQLKRLEKMCILMRVDAQPVEVPSFQSMPHLRHLAINMHVCQFSCSELVLPTDMFLGCPQLQEVSLGGLSASSAAALYALTNVVSLDLSTNLNNNLARVVSTLPKLQDLKLLRLQMTDSFNGTFKNLKVLQTAGFSFECQRPMPCWAPNLQSLKVTVPYEHLSERNSHAHIQSVSLEQPWALASVAAPYYKVSLPAMRSMHFMRAYEHDCGPHYGLCLNPVLRAHVQQLTKLHVVVDKLWTTGLGNQLLCALPCLAVLCVGRASNQFSLGSPTPTCLQHTAAFVEVMCECAPRLKQLETLQLSPEVFAGELGTGGSHVGTATSRPKGATPSQGPTGGSGHGAAPSQGAAGGSTHRTGPSQRVTGGSGHRAASSEGDTGRPGQSLEALLVGMAAAEKLQVVRFVAEVRSAVDSNSAGKALLQTYGLVQDTVFRADTAVGGLGYRVEMV